MERVIEDDDQDFGKGGNKMLWRDCERKAAQIVGPSGGRKGHQMDERQHKARFRTSKSLLQTRECM